MSEESTKTRNENGQKAGQETKQKKGWFRWRPLRMTRDAIRGQKEHHERYSPIRSSLFRSGFWTQLNTFIRHPQSVLDYSVRTETTHVTQDEMRIRYKNARLGAILQGSLACAMGGLAMISGSVLAFLCHIVALIAFLSLYINTAFRLWATRQMLAFWGQDNAPKSYRLRDYLAAIDQKASEILPKGCS